MLSRFRGRNDFQNAIPAKLSTVAPTPEGRGLKMFSTKMKVQTKKEKDMEMRQLRFPQKSKAKFVLGW